MGSISHQYLEEHAVVHVVIEGHVSGADISKSLVQIAEDYKHLSALYVIADYSKGIIEADPTYFLLNLNEVKDTFLKQFAHYKLFVNAYVLDTSENSSTRILLDQFRKVTKNIEAFKTEYFDDYDSALAWINEQRVS